MGENNPNDLMQRMVATAYEWHNYGKSTIGNRADIERVPSKPARFLRRYYSRIMRFWSSPASSSEEGLELVGKTLDESRGRRQLNSTIRGTAARRRADRAPAARGQRGRRGGDLSRAGRRRSDFPAVEVLTTFSRRSGGRLYSRWSRRKKRRPSMARRGRCTIPAS